MDKELKRKFKAQVISTEEIAKGVKKITFKIEEHFTFLPWQYVWVELLDMKYPDPKGSRRAFSILNAKNIDNTIEIVARISESGYKKSLFSLSNGDSVNIHGPFGNSFVVDQNSDKNIIMIAGGLGIAAFIRGIENIRDLSLPLKSFLVYVNKKEESTPFLSNLKTYKSKVKDFDYVVKYEHFNFNDIKKIRSNFGENIRFWVTGPQGFVDQVWSELEKNGILMKQVEFENFYPTPKYTLSPNDIRRSVDHEGVFSQAIKNTTNHIVITDARGVILYSNIASQKITGYSAEEMIGNTPRLWGGMMSGEFYRNFWAQKLLSGNFEGEILNRRKNGELYYTIAHISPIYDKEHNLVGFIGTEEDISTIKNREAELLKLNRFMVGRELEMIKLKEEIKKLKDTSK